MRLFRGSASPPRSILPLTILVLGVLAASYPARGQHTAYESPSSGTVTVVDGAGTTVDTGISDAQYLGRLSDLDDDGTLEVPVVDSNGNVELLTKNGMEAMLVSGRAETSKSSLGAGDVNDDGAPEIPGTISPQTAPRCRSIPNGCPSGGWSGCW